MTEMIQEQRKLILPHLKRLPHPNCSSFKHWGKRNSKKRTLLRGRQPWHKWPYRNSNIQRWKYKNSNWFSTSGFSSESVSLGTYQTLTISYTEGSVTKTATENGTFYVAAAGVKPTESPVPVYKDWFLGSDGYFMQNAQKIGVFLVMVFITTVTKHL